MSTSDRSVATHTTAVGWHLDRDAPVILRAMPFVLVFATAAALVVVDRRS